MVYNTCVCNYQSILYYYSNYIIKLLFIYYIYIVGKLSNEVKLQMHAVHHHSPIVADSPASPCMLIYTVPNFA